MQILLSFIIAIVVIVFHYWACRRSPAYWYLGAIVPVLWIGVNLVLLANDLIVFREDWKTLLFPTLIIFLMWAEGQQAAKKKEIAKMQARDL